MATYNACMKKFARMFALLALIAAAHDALAQGAPPPPPAPYEGRMVPRPGRQEWSAEQREQFREEMRLRREEWRQLSPEERRQLRHDIREAGRELYPRRGRHARE